MATILYIECDKCGRRTAQDWRNVGQRINFGVRSEIASQGWRSVHNRQLDYCPQCVRAGHGPKKKN